MGAGIPASVPRILQIDVPGGELDRTVAFWSGALGARPEPAPGGFVHLTGASSALEVHVQPLDAGSARYHLDFVATDRDTEIERLVGLGAERGRRFDDGYSVFADPAGLEHCVIDPDAARVTPTGRVAGIGYLHAVFIDVPRAIADSLVAFWAAVLDRPAHREDGTYTAITGVFAASGAPVGFEIQAIDDGAPRLHVDLCATDVASEVQRLVALGAEHERAHKDWVTLSDPCGNLLCIVPTGDGAT